MITVIRMHALKGQTLPRASHSGEIALVGSRRLRSTLEVAPFLSEIMRKLIVINTPKHSMYVHALKGQTLPRASHSGEIALVGSHRLRSTLAAAPVLFAHDVVTVAKAQVVSVSLI
jgi:hypothetical protein